MGDKGPSINYVGSLRGRGAAKSLFLPTMPNVFAYEGGEGESKIQKTLKRSCLKHL